MPMVQVGPSSFVWRDRTPDQVGVDEVMSALVDVTRERDELHDELIDERAYSAKLERQCARLAKEIGESVQRRLSEDKKRPWWRFWG